MVCVYKHPEKQKHLGIFKHEDILCVIAIGLLEIKKEYVGYMLMLH